jgi:hypothetical protein
MDDDDNLIWRQNYEGYSQAAAAPTVYYTSETISLAFN